MELASQPIAQGQQSRQPSRQPHRDRSQPQRIQQPQQLNGHSLNGQTLNGQPLKQHPQTGGAQPTQGPQFQPHNQQHGLSNQQIQDILKRLQDLKRQHGKAVTQVPQYLQLATMLSQDPNFQRQRSNANYFRGRSGSQNRQNTPLQSQNSLQQPQMQPAQQPRQFQQRSATQQVQQQTPAAGPSSSIFAPQQSQLLKHQISAFKRLVQGQPITPEVSNTINYAYNQLHAQLSRGKHRQRMPQQQPQQVPPPQPALQQQQQQQQQQRFNQYTRNVQLPQQQIPQPPQGPQPQPQVQIPQQVPVQQAQQAQQRRRASSRSFNRSSAASTPAPVKQSPMPMALPMANSAQIPQQVPVPTIPMQHPPQQAPVPSVPAVIETQVETGDPVPIHDFRASHHDLAVIPSNNPFDLVNSFSLPEAVRDVPYEYLNTAKSRLFTPSLMPPAFDLKGAAATEQLLESLYLDATVRSADGIDRAALELLPLQQAYRGYVLATVFHQNMLLTNQLPNFSARTRGINMGDASVVFALNQEQHTMVIQSRRKKIVERQTNLLQASEVYKNVVDGRRQRYHKLGKQVAAFHNQTEKEEQRRLERNAKQRLQALRANDEEAYVKLLDQTKDTRITHILRQTNTFLQSLTQAVKTQQHDTEEKLTVNGHTKEEETAATDDDDTENMDYYHVAHRIHETVDRQPDMLVGGELKEYQIRGLEWMVSLFNNHLNGILADEMGLGKTIQTISLLTYIYEKKNITGPFLIIVPLSTLPNWNMEFEKWAPTLKKISYKGPPSYRRELQQQVRKRDFDVLVTTYEYIIKDKAVLAKVPWVHMIIDEGHRMKNAKSKLSSTLTQYYHTDYRLILTGTPLQNNLPELWALLNFVLPKIFNSVKSFDEWFNTPFANTGSQDKIALSEEETLLVIRRLHKVLRPFLLRRLKKDVEKSLPSKVEKVIKCKKSGLQTKMYYQMLKFNKLFVGDKDSKAPVGIKGMNNKLMQLRKICNHPFVFPAIEDMINPRGETNDLLWRVSGKFELLDRILPKFQVTGHRALIFFQMTQIMDIMEDFLRYRSIKYLRLDGDTKADDRTTLLEQFNAPGSEYSIFLLSTRAGGLGLNLQSADTVIIFDTDWNPHQDLQAQDRAHRIGQKHEVRILRLITSDSIEEYILERAHQKLDIDGKVIQAGKFDQKSTSEEQEALLRKLLEEEENEKETDEDLDATELNQILARNEEEFELFTKMDEEQDTAFGGKPRLFTEAELPEMYNQEPEPEDELKEVLEYNEPRHRTVKHYDETMTEEQWLKAIDGYASDDDDEDKKPKRKSKKRSRAASETPEEKANALRKKPRGVRPAPPLCRDTSEPARYVSDADREAVRDNIIKIFEHIEDYTDEDGRKLSVIFLTKPQKRLYPDYYVIIKHPLAFSNIRRRIQHNIYDNLEEFLYDVHQMFKNARIYNQEGSVVFNDAQLLEDEAVRLYRELSGNEDVPDFDEFDRKFGITRAVAFGKPVGSSGFEDTANGPHHIEELAN